MCSYTSISLEYKMSIDQISHLDHVNSENQNLGLSFFALEITKNFKKSFIKTIINLIIYISQKLLCSLECLLLNVTYNYCNVYNKIFVLKRMKTILGKYKNERLIGYKLRIKMFFNGNDNKLSFPNLITYL